MIVMWYDPCAQCTMARRGEQIICIPDRASYEHHGRIDELMSQVEPHMVPGKTEEVEDNVFVSFQSTLEVEGDVDELWDFIQEIGF